MKISVPFRLVCLVLAWVSMFAQGGSGPDPCQRPILFDSGGWQEAEIWSMDPSGQNLTRVTDTPRGYSYKPAWSPDGKQIAFISNRDGQDSVYVMDSTGANTRRLTFPSKPEDVDGRCAWSPDGKQIVFQVGNSGPETNFDDWEIFVVNRDGTDLRQLTNNNFGDAHADWNWSYLPCRKVQRAAFDKVLPKGGRQVISKSNSQIGK